MLELMNARTQASIHRHACRVDGVGVRISTQEARMRQNLGVAFLVLGAACLLSTLLSAVPTAQSGGAAPVPAPTRVTWLILIDDLHMDFQNTGHHRELLRSLSAGLIREEDVVVMRSSGPSSITIRPTSDGRLSTPPFGGWRASV